MDAATHHTIERFVRGPLGCNCPDRVFEHIELEHKAEAFKKVLDETHYENSQVISIGGILLILTIEAASVESVVPLLEDIFMRGKEERDSKGFNRFRFVIATDHQKEAEQILMPRFQDIIGDDEKLHLHIIPPQSGSMAGGGLADNTKLQND